MRRDLVVYYHFNLYTFGGHGASPWLSLRLRPPCKPQIAASLLRCVHCHPCKTQLAVLRPPQLPESETN